MGGAGFAMRYWVEKWADLTVYKRPPLLDGKLFCSFDKLLMMLVVVQVMMATHFVAAAVRLTTHMIPELEPTIEKVELAGGRLSRMFCRADCTRKYRASTTRKLH